MASISVTDTSSDYISVVIVGLDTGYYGRPRKCNWFINNDLRKKDLIIPNGVSQGGGVSFTSLNPNTKYNIKAIITYSGGSVTLTTTASTTSGNRPNNWYWTSSVSIGSQIRLSASEWNNFCARINAFRKYTGLSNYNFTTVYSGTKISASIVNQARSAIGAIPGHGILPGAATSGGIITAYFFNQLMYALNGV